MIYDAVAASARTCCAICEKTCKLNIETNGELLRGVAAGSGDLPFGDNINNNNATLAALALSPWHLAATVASEFHKSEIVRRIKFICVCQGRHLQCAAGFGRPGHNINSLGSLR